MSYIKKIGESLESHGYVASDKIATQVALLLTQIGVRCMILDGPPGAGKTFLAKTVASMLGVKYMYTQAHPGSMPEDFLFDINLPRILRASAGGEPIEHDHEVWNLGFLPQIFELSQKGPVVAFIDELDKASRQVDSLFLAALQEGEIFVKDKKYECNRKNLILFFTKNNERELSEPLMRRCRREFLHYPSPELELKILSGSIRSDDPRVIGVPEQLEPKDIPLLLSKNIISEAAKLRCIKHYKKPPASSELFMCCQDIMKLVYWNCTECIPDVLLSWLAGYEQDRKTAIATIKFHEVVEKLIRSCRSANSDSSYRYFKEETDRNFHSTCQSNSEREKIFNG